jgi:hypothetical protein
MVDIVVEVGRGALTNSSWDLRARAERKVAGFGRVRKWCKCVLLRGELYCERQLPRRCIAAQVNGPADLRMAAAFLGAADGA